jgi:hypothetical protein
VSSVTDTFGSPKFQRYLLWVGLAVLVAGAMVLVVVILSGTTDSTTKAVTAPTTPTEGGPLRNSEGVPVKTYTQLDPQIRATVATFISTAVARQHVGKSWDVVAPSLKAGYTRSDWAKGELPVVPYPGVDTKHVRYSLDVASTKQILLEVGLIAKPGVRTKPVTFQLGLEPANGRWLVDYWVPRGTPVPDGQ